jgi:hypothetical protein
MTTIVWLRKSSSVVWLVLAIATIIAPHRAALADDSSDSEAAKQEIFASKAWQQAMAGLNEWLSVQVIYPQSEVPQLKREVVEKCNKMTAPELRAYLADLQQKLSLVSTPEATEIRSYIGYNLSVASDAYAAKIRRQLPDVLNMNALQVKQAMYNLQQQQAAVKSREAAFQDQRKTQLKLVQQWNQQTADASAAAAAQMNSWSGGGYTSPAPPRNPMPTYNPAPIYFGYGYGGWPW